MSDETVFKVSEEMFQTLVEFQEEIDDGKVSPKVAKPELAEPPQNGKQTKTIPNLNNNGHSTHSNSGSDRT